MAYLSLRYQCTLVLCRESPDAVIVKSQKFEKCSLKKLQKCLTLLVKKERLGLCRVRIKENMPIIWSLIEALNRNGSVLHVLNVCHRN